MVNKRLAHLAQFYNLLEVLESRSGKRTLSQCHGRQDWPARGVYFFFEPGEERTMSGTGPRVVRVGTHAVTAKSKATLWKRLSQHRGTVKSGGGNHRGSIFRLLVGEALARRDPSLACSNWGQDSNAPAEIRRAEHPLEALVSEHLGRMSLLCLPVLDAPSPQSQRGYIERNAIALLSNWGLETGEWNDLPSPEWLGRFSNRPEVTRSGLWNQKHISDSYDPAFLDVFSELTNRKT